MAFASATEVPAMVLRLGWMRASCSSRAEVQGMIDMAGEPILLREIMGSSTGGTVATGITYSTINKISKTGAGT